MDIQIKLVLRKYSYGNKLNYNDIIIFDDILNNNFNLNNNLFSFKEYDEVEVLFYSSDSNVFIEIESYDSDNSIYLKANNSIYLSQGGDSDNMLVPGYYEISIIKDKEEIKGFYIVEPNSIDFNSLMLIRETLNEICRGLSYNLYNERNNLEYTNNKTFESNLIKFNFLEKKFNEIISSILSIIKRPIQDITKEYFLRVNSKKPDNKSIRWLNKSNNNTNKRAVYKEKTIVSTYDINENKVIKLIAQNLLNYISSMEKSYLEYINQLKYSLTELEDKKRILIEEKCKIRFVYNVKIRSEEINRDIFILEKEIESYKSKIYKLSVSLNNTRDCKNYLALFLNQEWINLITSAKNIKITQKLLKRTDYYQLYIAYMEIFEEKNKKTILKSFPYKKTSLLYEIYSIIIVKDVLEEIGFNWTKGWLKGISDILSFNGDISSGEELTFENNDFVVVVSYDKLLRRTSELRKDSKSGIVASNSNKRRPDILISVFKNNIFIKSMIIEVKYRKFKSIYNNNIETDVMHQLKEYRNLEYFDQKLGKISSIRPIEKVMVIYPDNIEKKYLNNLYEFSFISLFPSTEKKPIGYNLIKEEIENFIFENI